MTRREDILASLAIAVWLLAMPIVLFLAWASLHGFDPSMCEQHAACAWRRA